MLVAACAAPSVVILAFALILDTRDTDLLSRLSAHRPSFRTHENRPNLIMRL